MTQPARSTGARRVSRAGQASSSGGGGDDADDDEENGYSFDGAREDSIGPNGAHEYEEGQEQHGAGLPQAVAARPIAVGDADLLDDGAELGASAENDEGEGVGAAPSHVGVSKEGDSEGDAGADQPPEGYEIVCDGDVCQMRPLKDSPDASDFAGDTTGDSNGAEGQEGSAIGDGAGGGGGGKDGDEVDGVPPTVDPGVSQLVRESF